MIIKSLRHSYFTAIFILFASISCKKDDQDSESNNQLNNLGCYLTSVNNELIHDDKGQTPKYQYINDSALIQEKTPSQSAFYFSHTVDKNRRIVKSNLYIEKNKAKPIQTLTYHYNKEGYISSLQSVMSGSERTYLFTYKDKNLTELHYKDSESDTPTLMYSFKYGNDELPHNFYHQDEYLFDDYLFAFAHPLASKGYFGKRSKNIMIGYNRLKFDANNTDWDIIRFQLEKDELGNINKLARIIDNNLAQTYQYKYSCK